MIYWQVAQIIMLAWFEVQMRCFFLVLSVLCGCVIGACRGRGDRRRLNVQCILDFVEEVIPIMHIFVGLNFVDKEVSILHVVVPNIQVEDMIIFIERNVNSRVRRKTIILQEMRVRTIKGIYLCCNSDCIRSTSAKSRRSSISFSHASAPSS